MPHDVIRFPSFFSVFDQEEAEKTRGLVPILEMTLLGMEERMFAVGRGTEPNAWLGDCEASFGAMSPTSPCRPRV